MKRDLVMVDSIVLGYEDARADVARLADELSDVLAAYGLTVEFVHSDGGEYLAICNDAGIADGRRALWQWLARWRVEHEPQLSQHADLLGAECWHADRYHWIANAPIADVLAWAELERCAD